MLNKRYILSRYNEIFFVLISFPVFLFQFLSAIYWKVKIKSWFKRHICYFNFHSILSRSNEILLF